MVVADRDESYGISVLAAKQTELWGNFVGINAAGVPSRPRANHSATTSASTSTTRPTRSSAAPAPRSTTSSRATSSASRSTAARTARRSPATSSARLYGTAAAPNTNGVAVVADGLGEAPADITVNHNTIAGSTNYGMYITGGAKRPS